MPAIPTGKTADENIQNGYVVPVDIASPKALMSSIGIAFKTGFPLLSDELLAEQNLQATNGHFLGDGFG